MIAFLTLTTADHDGRNVSVSYTDDSSKPCQLLGNLPHGSKFHRSDLIAFARAVLRELDNPTHNTKCTKSVEPCSCEECMFTPEPENTNKETSQ